MFEWMRAALNGPGALSSSGFFPGGGSPVVLDLGAVSQVCRGSERPSDLVAWAYFSPTRGGGGVVPDARACCISGEWRTEISLYIRFTRARSGRCGFCRSALPSCVLC